MPSTHSLEKQQQDRYPGLRIRREGGNVLVHVPVKFYRRNGRMQILTDTDHPLAPKPSPEKRVNQKLIDAIAKAHHWQEQIESGKYASIEDLAQSLKFDRTYVSRLLRLTSLAPGIIESILKGDEPYGMSLEKLRKNLPRNWEDQRKNWPISE